MSSVQFLDYFAKSFSRLPWVRRRALEVMTQIHFIAVESLPIVLLCVSFAAVVTIFESSYHMKIVIQNDSLVPGFASMLILRELGAVVTALLLASRVGAGFTAEIATMKTTEQIDALKSLNVDIYEYIVVPRLVGGVLSGAILVTIANLVCLFFAALVSVYYLNFTFGLFLSSMGRFVDFQDLMLSMVKGASFGLTIPLISCYYGLHAKPGAEGVGMATTESVVTTSVSIILIDFVLTGVFSFFY